MSQIDRNSVDCHRYYNIQSHNFELSQDEKKYIKLRLDYMALKLPSYSSLSLKFRRESKDFVGEFCCTSPITSFQVEKRGKNCSDVLAKIEDDIKEQIKAWKSARFKDREILPYNPTLSFSRYHQEVRNEAV